MGSSPLSLKRALLLSAFLALGVLAQNNNNNNNNPGKPGDTTTGNQNDATPTQTQPTNNDNNNKNTPTPTSQTSQAGQTTGTTPTDSPTTSPSTAQTTPDSSMTLPHLSTSTTTSETFLTGMPTLSTPADDSIPTYPPPTIPPTHNAPFMNHSTLPDGTVFIAVGAILGAFGVAVLAWRGIVACMLHRSVARAAMAQHAANNGRGVADKNAASFPAPPAQFYKYIERESSPSLGGPGLGGSTGRRTHRGPTPSATPSQTNLFFSPTAAGSSSGLGAAGASNRDSARFLPSGFYAAASPVAGGHGHGHGNSISMSTLRPSSRGRAGQMGPSPPESPDVGPRVASRNFSTSSLNLNRPPSAGARAPSAYLDDLLDEQPGQFPPAAGSPTSPHGHGGPGRRF
ncbi:0f0d9aef-d1a8-4ce3-83d7-704f51003053 [Thermothielavioides terrestris]|uniref:0f0d9aef-d1a8-4ce3-83d7-704f51003053 n=1 Tax=Thermothielavioides terrestris TaxID=2587410 RepID=A0A3S4EWK1_9PEZI|nr:0f0d9aef-d1a8-4ce3-83d7-704f51003053 [Thermothielavioides terrestris]